MNTAPHARRCVPAALSLTLGLAGTAFAGGFALVEQNANGAGLAWSNAAAATDASTVFFNPAGLAWLEKPELVAGAHAIAFGARFRDAGSTTAGVLPLTGTNGGNAGGTTPLPNFYFARPLAHGLSVGVGASVPWGLSTDYDANWVGRYHALKSELRTVNVTTAVGWRVSPQMSVGLGLQAQRASVELGNAVDFGLLGYTLGVPGFAPGAVDGAVRVSGDDMAYGFTAGFLYEFAPGARLGASYRSKMKHGFTGDAEFSGVPAPFAALFPNQRARSSLATPATLSVHALEDVGPVRFTADVTWWDFSTFKTLALDFENPATPDAAQAQNWKDAAIYSVGAAWRMNDAVTLRVGAAYNKSPVPNAQLRTARIPDSDRRWLAFGVEWRATEHAVVHAGYTHLFFSDAAIDNVDGATHRLTGTYRLSADLYSVQGTWRF